MRKSVFLVSLCLWCLVLWPGLVAYADDAQVLPKGVFGVDVESKFYLPTEKRFNPDGDREDVAVDFNATLNSSVFPALGLVEGGFGLPPGTANLGNSVVSFEYKFTDLLLTLQYGVTDQLTVGVIVPYYWQKNTVSARLDTRRATVGKNATFNTLAPLAFPGTVPLQTEDVLALLSGGLDINGDGQVDIPGFGYKRFATWSDSGFGDLEAGFRYQYLKTKHWRLAFTGGARFPTGQVDDPDNLVDFEFGTGAYALLFRFNNDFTGVKNLVLNGTFRYDLVLPDSQTKRVLDNVNQPLTTNREDVDRDLGDIFEFEVSGRYTLCKGFSLSALYEFGFKLKDRISGTQGFAYESLEDETDWTSHIFIVGASYSTIPLYREKKFPVPLEVSLSYRDRFAGTNNVLATQFISLQVRGFF